MASYAQLALLAFLLSAVVMTLVWWRQVYTKNAGIVDAWWSYNFGLIALMFGSINLLQGEWLKSLAAIPVIIWSVRLGTHLLIRNTNHDHEDSRYRQLRLEYGDRENFLMWRFFMYQAISNVVLSLPFLMIAADHDFQYTWVAVIGFFIWLTGMIGESIADHQLKQFKSNPVNKSAVCERGLWYYSRHPNYFFEWMIWVGFALISSCASYGWISFVCPIIMYFLLTKVTGIPMLEAQAVQSKGNAYIRYQQSTSAFFPWFKKK